MTVNQINQSQFFLKVAKNGASNILQFAVEPQNNIRNDQEVNLKAQGIKNEV